MDQDNHTITASIATAITIVSRSEERLNARGFGQCFGDPFINPVSKYLVSLAFLFVSNCSRMSLSLLSR
jgi:hypothetical protein